MAIELKANNPLLGILHINQQLRFLTYENAIHSSSNQVDMVRVKWMQYEVDIPIKIVPRNDVFERV